MQRRAYRRSRRPRDDRGCLGNLVIFAVLLMVLVAIYGLVGRPMVSAAIGGLLGDQLGAPAPGAAAGAAAAEQLEGALPAVVAALPSGEIVISEQEANAYLAASPQELAPLERLVVRFTPGRAEADLAAFGASGTLSGGLAASQGQVVVVSPRLDGALGLAMSPGELLAPLAERLNAELARQGRVVQDVRVEQGRIVLVVQ